MTKKIALPSSMTVFAVDCLDLDRIAFDAASEKSDLYLVLPNQEVLFVSDIRVERCFRLLESAAPEIDYATLLEWVEPETVDVRIPAGIPIPADLRDRRYKGYGRASPRTDGTAVFDLSF